jgi:hypothetical protein
MKHIAIANPFSGIQLPAGQGGSDINLSSGTLTIGGIITKALPYVFSASALLLLVYMSISGIQLMTSRGDPKAIEGAKARITNAIIGFVILLLSYAIVKLLGQILGLTIFTQIFT